jgi:hypothetical protein
MKKQKTKQPKKNKINKESEKQSEKISELIAEIGRMGIAMEQLENTNLELKHTIAALIKDLKEKDGKLNIIQSVMDK